MRNLFRRFRGIASFLNGLADGELTPDEAGRIANLPTNLQMMRHRRDLGYVPPPLPAPRSLARLIRMAGSRDPLDRLWCWINPQNCFDYADIALNRREYARLLATIKANRRRIEGAVLSRIAAFAPAGQRFGGFGG